MHAEMQLLEELVSRGVTVQGLDMGVSKPCCYDCHQVLRSFKINHTAFHRDQVQNWEAPNL